MEWVFAMFALLIGLVVFAIGLVGLVAYQLLDTIARLFRRR